MTLSDLETLSEIFNDMKHLSATAKLLFCTYKYSK